MGFEEGAAVVPRKDYSRSDSDNWRTLREEQQEEEEAAAAAAAAAAAGGAGGVAAAAPAAAASAGTTEPGSSWRTMGGRHDGTYTHSFTFLMYASGTHIYIRV